MSEAIVLFTLDGENLTIQCTTEDKMKDICNNYSSKINKNMNSLLFLYEGNKVNFELCFYEQANFTDRNNYQMKILVSECDGKNNINSEKLDEIILSNNKKENDNADIKKNNEKENNLFSDCINNKNSNNNIGVGNRNLLVEIKSIYFSRLLFSHLDEKIKLKVIKYNKKLQNNIDIKLVNYKFYSGRYIIYENKFKGKEYEGYYNTIVFEGEYLNGERNGKGKEYISSLYNVYLKFEGEYLNGKKNGKGKEYNEDGKLLFEGEYLDGERNGKVVI